MDKLKQVFENISVREAEKLLGLSSGWTKDDLTLAYRRAAIKNHPDRGGSVEDMKAINNAKDALDKIKPTSSNPVDAHRKAWAENFTKCKEFIEDDIRSKVDLNAFLKHLESIFKEKFQGAFTFGKTYLDGSFAKLKIHNADNTKQFELTINPDINEMVNNMNTKSLGGGEKQLDTVPYSVGLQGFYYSGNRKTRVFNSRWMKSNKYSNFSDPETIFPKKKLADGAPRKFSKRDMLTGLEIIPGVQWSTDRTQVFIPIKEGDGKIFFCAVRGTMIGSAAWMTHGFYPSRLSKDLPDMPFMSFQETEELLDAFRHVPKLNAEQIVKLFKTLYEKSK